MSDLAVVNRALYRLGSQPATTMSDTTKNQARAIAAYSVCRDEVLRLLPWPSCVKRALLKNWADQATPWTASHAYEVGDRCTNDTAKTYECTVAGTSASSGGPTGTDSAITDGTVTWTYKEASTTTNNWCWAASTAYVVDDLVSNDTGKVYVCITAGTSDSSGGPTGTTTDITDNTAHWAYYGTPPKNRTTHTYTYILPPDCLRILKIPDLTADEESDQGVQYLREGHWIYCSQDESHIRYIKQEDNADNWDDLLKSTIVLRIASVIAYDVTGHRDIAKAIYDEFVAMFSTASTVAMNEGAEGPVEIPRWEDA